MESITDVVSRLADQFVPICENLINHHSGLQYDNPDQGAVFFVNPSGDHRWMPLTDEGLRLQHRALEEYRRLVAIVRTLMHGSSQSSLDNLKEFDETIVSMIEQSHSTWCKTTNEAFEKIAKAIRSQTQLLGRLYSSDDGEIIIHDTNARLLNPRIEMWMFNGIDRFTLVLTPTVLKELDKLKINDRNPEVREKLEPSSVESKDIVEEAA